MTDKTREAIKGMMAGLGASRYKKAKPWNGYDVYKPVYTEMAYRGLPFVVLVKDGKVRLSTPDETLDYTDFLYPSDEDDED